MNFGTIPQAVADIKAGKLVVVADDEDRENEGDLICAAQLITPALVNFMLRAKGMICLALTGERAHVTIAAEDERVEAVGPHRREALVEPRHAPAVSSVAGRERRR